MILSIAGSPLFVRYLIASAASRAAIIPGIGPMTPSIEHGVYPLSSRVSGNMSE